MRWKWHVFLGLLLLILAALSPLILLRGRLVATSVPSQPSLGLQTMLQFDRLPYLNLDTMAGGASSYDRAGLNSDGFGKSNFLYTDKSGDKVMLDLKGPGTIYRMWFTGFNPSTAYVKVYFDGEKRPRINMLLRDMFSGKKEPFLAPLVADNKTSSGGFVSYLPLSFSSSIRITTNGTGDHFFYNFGYHKYSPDTQVTSWTGREDSLAVRELWNRAGLDPKSTDGSTAVSGQLNVAPGTAQTLLDTAGPGSVSAIKFRIPGVEAPPEIEAVADYGRAHKGSSEFTMAIPPDNAGITLTRRLDAGIANQAAQVFVDDALAGEWLTSGSGGQRWVDSSFEIPASFTAGKSAIRIRIQFISSSVDWNEFAYWTTSGGTETDRLDVADDASEQAHKYLIKNATWWGERTYRYASPAVAERVKEILNNTWLQIHWDNEPTPSVNAPLGSFFGMGQFGPYRTRALPVGIDEENQLYVYFPMPFQARAQIQLVNETSSALGGSFEIQHKPFADSFDNVGTFKTLFRSEQPTTRGSDILVLDTTGSGRFLGFVESMQGTTTRWFLEGDERIYVDGSLSPAIHGTGTEDFFNAGWYFDRGLFTLPMHGYTANEVGYDDSTAAYRFFLQDAIPFRNRIRVSIEHGATNDAQIDVWTLAFYYHMPKERSVLTDTLDVGDGASEASHAYVIKKPTWEGTLTHGYEGDFSGDFVTDTGRAHQESSEFDLAIDAANQGVMLRRRFDQNVANQEAKVYVDGKLVGTWYRAGSNSHYRWRDDDFLIPASFTNGKEKIRVRVENVSKSADWSEFAYQAFTLVP